MLDFGQAQTKARELAGGGDRSASESAPGTVEGALDNYATDLKARHDEPSRNGRKCI
jgi:hypothetical protein